MEREDLLEQLVSTQQKLIARLEDELATVNADYTLAKQIHDDQLGAFVNIAEFIGSDCTTKDAIKICTDLFWDQHKDVM